MGSSKGSRGRSFVARHAGSLPAPSNRGGRPKYLPPSSREHAISVRWCWLNVELGALGKG